VEYRGHHLWTDREADGSSSRRAGRNGRRRGFNADGLSFMIRWVFAVSAAMLVAGLMEYGVARQQITDRGLADSRRNYEALAEGLEQALAADVDPLQREKLIAAEVRHLQHSQGTVYVGLFDAAGKLIVRGGDEDGGASDHADASRFSGVLSTGQTTVTSEAELGGTGVTRYEFLMPVSAPEGTLVLEIDQHADIIAELVGDLAPNKILGLLTAIVVATPLSYFFGGRSLQRRQLRTQQQADGDPLTGLAGRRPFQPSLEATLTDRRYSVMTLALLDIDGFKQINDRLGHSHGDRVLRAFADSFQVLPASDTPFVSAVTSSRSFCLAATKTGQPKRWTRSGWPLPNGSRA
jgi:predicted signal transduction protein with EAL and GGDEF domain